METLAPVLIIHVASLSRRRSFHMAFGVVSALKIQSIALMAPATVISLLGHKHTHATEASLASQHERSMAKMLSRIVLVPQQVSGVVQCRKSFRNESNKSTHIQSSNVTEILRGQDAFAYPEDIDAVIGVSSFWSMFDRSQHGALFVGVKT
ncbi:hypothetical protein CC78DRAFT_578271 [Lojkania enalia]|uniref:Uncharacterized protein n=1 Tax=Lojkania enalia TaxID=147567 RepID=A0A9P4N8S0_9PLEO|nr:hypothetical protein CC78DRAFT_578271 [Didymosphaeria enalia]